MQDTTILVTTDFHAQRAALEGLGRLLANKTYGAVIMAGDLINPRTSELGYVEEFLALVQQKHRLPLFGLHGNNEPEEAYKLYRNANINIHLESRQWNNYTICGVGGFGYLNEPGFEDLSVENLELGPQTIFVTHVPPRKVEATSHGPLIHLFGHRHSLAYAQPLGNTLQVQCPAGELGRATEIDLPSRTVRFINF